MSVRNDAQTRVAELEKRLATIDQERAAVASELDEARGLLLAAEADAVADLHRDAPVTMGSSTAAKVTLFRSLFRGRTDVFPQRWDNPKTAKSGYSLVCRNEWFRNVCGKPKIKCGKCPSQAFIAVTDEVIRNHLQGRDPAVTRRGNGSFIAGVYPLLPDETCWFLAADFDKQDWQRDVTAFLTTCRDKGIPAALERSRSGNGGHVWIFFSEPVPAAEARRLGSWLITETMERRPDIGFDSYDRFFPNQDTMPAGGFGNLIALPLQHGPRADGNSVFIGDNFRPYPDQWAFLSTQRRMARREVVALIGEAASSVASGLIGRAVGPRLDGASAPRVPASRSRRHSDSIDEYIPSRRRMAPTPPFPKA